MSGAVAATRQISRLLLMPTPPVLIGAPSLFLATLILSIILAPAAAAAASLRRPLQRAGGARAERAAAGASAGVLFVLSLWLAAMFAVTLLWAGTMLVFSQSTLDAAHTLRSVDPAMNRLIFQASGGATNASVTGFLLPIGDEDGGPKRNVDIGKSSCSLSCFTFARAMMSSNTDCFCDIPIMGQIHKVSAHSFSAHLIPAAVCAILALASVLGLFACSASHFGAAGAGAGAAPGKGGAAVGSDDGSGAADPEALKGGAHGSPGDGLSGRDQWAA